MATGRKDTTFGKQGEKPREVGVFNLRTQTTDGKVSGVSFVKE